MTHSPSADTTSAAAPARNVEIKARIESVAALLPIAQALSEGPPEPIAQDDTFFACPQGRLKLRQFDESHGQLIFYQRADATGPKTSFYRITATHEPAVLRDVLAVAYGVVGRVRKQRLLLLAGRTRLHLDQVQDLGAFLELEVVLREGESAADGVAEARALMQALGVPESAWVEGAYVDLLRGG